MKFVKQKVSIAPINSSEAARLIYYEPRLQVDEIPENSRKVLRWVDEFEYMGLDFNTGEMHQPSTLDLVYNIGYGAYITYEPGMNTGIIKYYNLSDWRSEMLLRRENYFMIIEYEEVYPTLEELKGIPIIDLVKYCVDIADDYKKLRGDK